MKFVSLDVETANPDYSSICQIGIAVFENGELIDTWSSLINPEEYFDDINVSIHGINETQVIDAPKLPEVYEKIRNLTENNIVAHHMPFDRVAISRAFEKYNLNTFNILWLDSAKVARRVWSEFAYKGYGLKNIADRLEISFKHHNALDDAIVSGSIVIKAMEQLETTLDGVFSRAGQPINLENINSNSKIKLDGNQNGALWGETIVFTGTLSIPRKEAAELAARAGCNVIDNINKDVTMLVVGIQDVKKFNGKEKSSKQIKTEKLISSGLDIKIITEEDFKEIISCTSA